MESVSYGSNMLSYNRFLFFPPLVAIWLREVDSKFSQYGVDLTDIGHRARCSPNDIAAPTAAPGLCAKSVRWVSSSASWLHRRGVHR